MYMTRQHVEYELWRTSSRELPDLVLLLPLRRGERPPIVPNRFLQRHRRPACRKRSLMPLNKAVPLFAVNVCASGATMAGHVVVSRERSERRDSRERAQHDLHGSPHGSSHLFRVRVAEMASGIVAACETASLKDLGEKIRALASVHTEMIDELCSPETRKHSALKDKDKLSGSPGKRSFSTALSTHSVACALEAQGTLPGSPAEQEFTAVVGTLKVEGNAQGAVAEESATAADGSAAAEPGAVETPAIPALARDEGADAAPIHQTRRLRWLPSIGGVADCIRRPLCCLAPRLIASESASTATAIDTPSATMSLSIDVPGLDDSDMGDMGDMDDTPPATPYDPSSAGVTGFLIDLDGTMYDPAGLLPGASAFYHWLVASGAPHVFLSNTGAKNAASVQRKLASSHYRIAGPEHLVPLDHILTASEAQCDYMLDNIPAGSKVLVISGGEGTWRSDLRTRGGAKGEQLLDTWELRSYIGRIY